ncbi:MAG: class I SAM-dependent methyltransferase [Nitrospira sp.]|nr:class I SAM-dependent methyltransferase [Nitrospira sp.]
MHEFDPLASQYKHLLDQSISFSGSEGTFFADHKARLIAETIGHEFSGTALDYGCGIGLLVSCLRKRLPCAMIHGFDPSVESLRVIGPATRNGELFTSAEADLAPAYDLVVMANVLHHVPREERQPLVSRLARRVRANGHFIIFEHNPINPLTRWVVQHSALDKNALLLKPHEAVSYLQEAFSVVRRTYVMFSPAPLQWLNWMEPRLTWCPLGAQYMVTGQQLTTPVPTQA